MSHPTFWPKKSFFYPIGNTPPVCLTDHLPPEKDAVVLLLGCGDPRNILYTVMVDHGTASRVMDFTCCDLEPAIIARNVLLFTFIRDSIEDVNILHYWSIFYDVFLDKKAATLLNEQCKKLIEYSEDIATWAASPYGDFLKFATVDSLNEARRHWESYRETFDLPAAEQTQLKKIFVASMRARTIEGGDASATPSAAPLSFEFPTTCKTYTKYWESGITNPKVNSNTPTQVNPTFLFSLFGRQFNLHYGTDLCTSFHLALALTPVSFDGGPASTPAKTEREMWAACRAQFSRWCVAFHKRFIASGGAQNIVIRFAVGDALAFCDGLQLCQTGDWTPTIYTSGWGGSKFSFHDNSMPTIFNVIDSSNLSDHLGLLNILVAATPLLHKKPETVLHTNSLLSYKNHPTQKSAVEERTLMDFPSLALFLGITPLCYLTGLTFRNNNEIATLAAMVQPRDGRHYERISWRFSNFAHTNWDDLSAQNNSEVRFRPTDLGDKLFSVYLKMFENENFNSVFSRMGGKDLPTTIIANPHYHRQSFARFLCIARAHSSIKTDWHAAIGHFVDRVVTSKELLVGANNCQNIFAELHTRGVYSGDSIFLPGYVTTNFGPKPIPFATWDTIPPVVCVVLRVPRAALQPLEELHVNKVGHPILECETYHQSHNVHSSIRPIFGDIVDSEGRKVIIEDPRGMDGTSPLIVSFFVASWILAEQPNDLQIGLCIKSTPQETFTFLQKLGVNLRLYSSSLLNKNNVFILPERPDNQGELSRVLDMNKILPRTKDENSPDITTISLDKGTTILSKRLDITEPDAKEALASGAPVEVIQTTPLSVEVRIGDHICYSLCYPIPVDGLQSKTRIARKSGYVEVDVPSRSSPLKQLTLQPFPMTVDIKDNRPQYICWNAPYVNPGRLPLLSPSRNLRWVNNHLSFSLSPHERGLQRSAPAKMWGTLINFKISVANLLNKYLETGNQVHVLQGPTPRDPHPIIFFSSVRMDLSSATLVGDAAIVFPELPMARLLSRCMDGAVVVTTFVHGQEIRLWNHAFPAFVERCRQWEHLPTCEYIRLQRVPLSVEYGETPVCSCGKGKNLPPLLFENSRWKPLAPYAVRIALTPSFPVTYLEDFSQEALAILTGGAPGGRSVPPAAPTPNAVPRKANGCELCNGPGKPKLLNCGGCQSVKYCSKDCQTADWKRHKHACKSSVKNVT